MGDTDKSVEIQHTKSKSKKSAAAEQVAKMRQAALSVTPVPAPVELVMMPVSLIDCAAQVRTLFDDASLAELAADIARRGVIQPILLRPVADGRFRLIAGERRLRACILAQLPTIPAIVGQIDDEGAEDMQLAENIQREDLNLVDTAAAVKRLYEKLGNVQAVAEKCHKSKAWISKHLAIADGLNHYAAKLLADGVTEDLETLKAVSDLEQITPGTNTAWALCEKIRSGKAGRTAAREALAAAKDAADPAKREQRQRKKDAESKAREDALQYEVVPKQHMSTGYWTMVKNPEWTWYEHQANALFRIARQFNNPECNALANEYAIEKQHIENLERLASEHRDAMKAKAAQCAEEIRQHYGKAFFEIAYDKAEEQSGD